MITFIIILITNRYDKDIFFFKSTQVKCSTIECITTENNHTLTFIMYKKSKHQTHTHKNIVELPALFTSLLQTKN